MKSIERRFEKLRQSNSDLSSYTSFSEAVKDGGFGANSIRHWFNRLVDKDDYCQRDKKTLLDYLDSLSNPLRTIENEGKFNRRAPSIHISISKVI